jgi:hypothetical protein
MRTAIVGAILMMTAATAWAHPPPPPPDPEPETIPARPAFEWSTWVRVAYGVATDDAQPRARIVTPQPVPEDHGDHGWESAAGIDLTVAIGPSGKVRLGPWGEIRTSSDAVIGGELVLAGRPAKLDMFWYAGEGVLIARAGGNRGVRTAALAYGYRAPWKLWEGKERSRYRIGVRMVASVTQARDDHQNWSATFGLETEPVGALRYLLGIKSWY